MLKQKKLDPFENLGQEPQILRWSIPIGHVRLFYFEILSSHCLPYIAKRNDWTKNPKAWRRFRSMETIFSLSKHSVLCFFGTHASLVKPKNRLHRLKSSSWHTEYQYTGTEVLSLRWLQNTEYWFCQKKWPNQESLRSHEDIFGRWRRFFSLSKHSVLCFFGTHASLVKPKNRLYRPKPSPCHPKYQYTGTKQE